MTSDTKGLGPSTDGLALMSTKTVGAEEGVGSRSDAMGGGGVPEILPRAPLRNEEQWEDTPLSSLFSAAGKVLCGAGEGEGEAQFFLCRAWREMK